MITVGKSSERPRQERESVTASLRRAGLPNLVTASSTATCAHVQRTVGNLAIQRYAASGSERTPDPKKGAQVGSNQAAGGQLGIVAQESGANSGLPIIQLHPVSAVPGRPDEASVIPTHSASQPLDENTRVAMESRHRAELHDVRVHTDSVAASSAQALRAEAYTSGRDIYFAAGKYSPATTHGRQLISHEIFHVIQQGRGLTPQRTESTNGILIGHPEDTLEHEAEREAAVTSTQDAFTGRIPTNRRTPDYPKNVTEQPSGRVVQRQSTSQALPLNYSPAPPPMVSKAASDSPEEKKKPPEPGGATVRHWNILLSKDPVFVRYQLERLVADRGLKSLDSFLESFRDRVAKDMDVVREPMRPTQAFPTPSVPIQAGDKAVTMLEMEIAPVLLQQGQKLKDDVADFGKYFVAHGRDVVLETLFDSEKRVKAEALHYGAALDKKWGEVSTPPDASSEKSELAKKEREEMGRAASTLAAKHQEVVDAQNHFENAKNAPASKDDYMYRMVLYTQAQEELGKKQHELALLRAEKESRFPLLAAYTSRDRWGELEEIVKTKPEGMAGEIGNEVTKTLENIETVRNKLADDKVDIWKLPVVVQMVKNRLHIQPGSMEDRLVSERVHEANDDTTKLVLGIVLIGLGLLAAIPTGGSSLAAAVVVAAEIGSAMVGGYLVIQGFQEYLLQKAENGTDFDKAQAISQEEPTLFWLALDIVGVVLNVRGALAAFRRLAALRQLALIRQATRTGEAAGAEVLKAAEQEGNAIKRGLGDKLRQEIVGHAQSPKIPWRPNAEGPRTIEEAVEIARKNGVHIPEDVKFSLSKTPLPKNRFAEYAQLGMKNLETDVVTWEQFYNRFEQIPVRLSDEVLKSDEAIVAVMGHEMHELNSLRELFEKAGGRMRARRLHDLIREGVPGNLHDQAWDVADDLVSRMRKP
jgi:Domain of unknown function (DUF4157)